MSVEILVHDDHARPDSRFLVTITVVTTEEFGRYDAVWAALCDENGDIIQNTVVRRHSWAPTTDSKTVQWQDRWFRNLPVRKWYRFRAGADFESHTIKTATSRAINLWEQMTPYLLG
ncbi:hypothetical protein O1611_g2224 [Lasiodiplodia mahajangana]|uniref:Uncharacterized protein n=1 Tax=Lasiodiplodia mahajangana TaxID=1108764 RepID=A0ACC2JV63_9PEZI|nr:hypothetical protein O1611_g2224 [Lasiodiplodia mahajangana]